MKRFELKRHIALMLVVLMVLGSTGMATAKPANAGNGNSWKNSADGTEIQSPSASESIGRAVGKTRNDAKAKALYDLNLFKGTSNSEFVAELARGATRIEAITLIGRALQWEKEPDFNSSSVPVPTDITNRDAEMIKYVQYALAHDVTKGIGNGVFGADLPVNARMMYTWYARALLYEEDVWNNPEVLEALGFLNKEQLQSMEWEIASTRDDLVGIMYESMKWKIKGTNMKLVQRMVKNMWLDYKSAVKAGLMDPEETEMSYSVRQESRNTLKLTFSHALNEVAAENANNYTIHVRHRPYGAVDMDTVSGGAIVVTGGAITVEGFVVEADDYAATLSEEGNVVTLTFVDDFLVGDRVFVTPSQNVVSTIHGYVLDDRKDTRMVVIR